MDIGKISLIMGLFLTLANLLNWIYKYFNGAYKLKKDKHDLKESVTKHELEVNNLKNNYSEVIAKLEDLFEINKIQTRHAIVSSCIEAIERGHIEEYQLRSLEDMYTMYKDTLHGNSYTTTLMKRVRHLEIRTGD